MSKLIKLSLKKVSENISKALNNIYSIQINNYKTLEELQRACEKSNKELKEAKSFLLEADDYINAIEGEFKN